MTKFFIKFILITTSFIIFPAISFAELSKILFTTNQQSIRVNILSEPMVIQAQDSSGGVYQTPETIDLKFTSTSPTGEFLGSTGNPAMQYMSKNTANRTFYYRDSTEGVFTITVNATGRDSGKNWNASQKITVASSDSVNNPPEKISSNTQSSQISLSQSATSGAAAPNYATQNSPLEVYAGGDRLTSPGSPTLFQALVKKNNVSNQAFDFFWSFGDGYIDKGALVSHTYKYAGEYAVILNAKIGDAFAISRLKVMAIEPDISISEEDSYIEISNNSNSEINLFNWKLINNGKGFIFQPDTIILAKSKIKIDKSFFIIKGQSEEGTVLKNSLGDRITSIPKLPKNKDLKEISSQIEKIQEQTNTLIDKAVVSNLIRVSTSPLFTTKLPDTNGISINLDKNRKTLKKNESGMPEKTTIYETPKKDNWVRRVFNFLIELFR